MTRDEALAWLAQVFEEPAGNVRPDTPRDEIVGWDSLGVLTLMADLDEKFNLQLSENESKDMKSIKDLLAFLEKNGAVSG
jgi:acyl carrier protein